MIITVSFIIPIYKVEQYLEQCVNSILNQTYRSIEVILVDDGSPDHCPVMCDAFAEKDARVKVLHKPNGGLSDARNAGLQAASGDYVIFVDSDDFWVNTNCLQELMTVVCENLECDFIGFNCSYYYQDSQTYKRWVEYDEVLSVPTDKNAAMCALVASGTMPMSACLKVISRKSLLNMRLTFKKGILSEDVPWFVDLLDGCDKCMFVNQYIYAYRQNVAGSISSHVGERNFISILDIIKTELGKIDARSFTSESKDFLRSFLAYELSILISATRNLPKDKQSAARKELKQLCWLLKYTQNPKVRMVSRVYNVFGYSITEWVLGVYDWYRRKKN